MQSLAKRAQTVGDKLTGIGQRMSLAFTAPLVAAGIYALKTSAQFEQLDIQFNTLLGSAEKGAAFVAAIKDFAVKTPFDIADVSEYASRLLGAQISTEKIIPTLTDLGNIASIVGKQKLPNLITAVAQISSKGVLAGQELMQLQETSIPILSELAKVTGHSIQEISGDTKRLGITSAQVMQAIHNMASGTGLFANAMENQADSLTQQWQTFREQLELLSDEIGDILRPHTKVLLELFSDLVAKFRKLSPEMKKAIVVILGIVAAIGPLLVILGQLAFAVAALSTSWALLLPAAVIIAKIAAALLILWVLYDDFKAYLDGQPNLFGPVWEKMLQAVNWVIKKWNKMMQFFQDSLLVFKTDGGAILDEIKAQFKTSFDNTAMESFGKALGQIWDWLVKINDYLGVTDKITSVFKAMTGIGGLEEAALNIQNRANEIDPNRSIRGGTPLYVNPVNIPAFNNGVGPGSTVQKKDVKLTQSINIKVDASESMQKIAETIREETSKLLGRESEMISDAVGGGPIN